ncbi:MAG: saccharopine dehydrogenase NADP-binding domain-containing protein [Anaerolineae bacterium]|jgi:lysine 6-dehydrogenase|nr:saccharopine dehydrogenase NADP-binding domain-containing protein [Anaerolineae bacterium]MDH7473693.1 saccharopine dehydrogenase C-terminal domain-containing protein [Anaerolineae bacterium]
MAYNYAVLGAGRQGTAAAYDLAKHGDAARVVLADANLEQARAAAQRVNALLGTDSAEAAQVDVTEHAAVVRVLRDIDAFLSAVPYYYNLSITRAAIEAGASMCDLGGNTDIVRQQQALDAEAKAKGISIIPDCGQVPGLGTTLMVYTMKLLDKPREVTMWDGGLPQNPKPPFNYLLTFNIAGLTNEYAEPAVFIRGGKVTKVGPMTELHTVEFPPPIGTLEAFVTGGGTSTAPWTFEGQLQTFQNFTVRYPGHFAQLRAYYDLGLWDLHPIRVGAVEVVPRDVFHALFEPRVTIPGERDLVVIRVRAVGQKDGQEAEAVVELVDFFDEVTGFTAMERTTGWDAAIVVAMMARGETPRGAGSVETFVPPAAFVSELRQRGFNLSERVTVLGQ